MGIKIKSQGAVEQKRCGAEFEAYVGQHLDVILENAAHHVMPQAPHGEGNARDRERDVIPAQAKALAHETRRNEEAERHEYDQQRTSQIDPGGLLVKGIPGVQAEMQ